MNANVTHIPVALEQCIKMLAPAILDKKNPVLIDATLG
jgi:16S rRNA (cytosine1402-N4)-methyltransferase